MLFDVKVYRYSKGGEWFVALLSSPAERVSGKTIRLALALTKTASNRAKVFGDAAMGGCGAGGAGDLLAAAFELATNADSVGLALLTSLCYFAVKTQSFDALPI